MAKKARRNIKLVADWTYKNAWFDIYIDCSGGREHLMSHRRDRRIYDLLKDGVRITELERSASKLVSDVSLYGCKCARNGSGQNRKCRKNRAKKLDNPIAHLINVANEYIAELSRTA